MIGIEVMQNSLVLRPIEIDATYRDRYYFRARRLDRLDHLFVRRVLARSDHQARAELASGDGERLRVGEGCG